MRLLLSARTYAIALLALSVMRGCDDSSGSSSSGADATDAGDMGDVSVAFDVGGQEQGDSQLVGDAPPLPDPSVLVGHWSQDMIGDCTQLFTWLTFHELENRFFITIVDENACETPAELYTTLTGSWAEDEGVLAMTWQAHDREQVWEASWVVVDLPWSDAPALNVFAYTPTNDTNTFVGHQRRLRATETAYSDIRTSTEIAFAFDPFTAPPGSDCEMSVSIDVAVDLGGNAMPSEGRETFDLACRVDALDDSTLSQIIPVEPGESFFDWSGMLEARGVRERYDMAVSNAMWSAFVWPINVDRDQPGPLFANTSVAWWYDSIAPPR